MNSTNSTWTTEMDSSMDVMSHDFTVSTGKTLPRKYRFGGQKPRHRPMAEETAAGPPLCFATWAIRGVTRWSGQR